MTDILGMHWTLALTIISIVLMIVDLFIFQGGGLTFISDIFFTFVILHFVPTENWIWLTLWSILTYALILSIHWYVYSKFAKYFVNKFLAPQKRKNNNEILIGRTGTICWIEERGYIHLEDEHIPCTLENGSVTSDSVNKKAKVISWNESGELKVTIID